MREKAMKKQNIVTERKKERKKERKGKNERENNLR